MRSGLAFVLGAILTSASACGEEPSGEESPRAMVPIEASPEAFPEGTILALLDADGRFETFLTLLKERSPSQLQRMSGQNFPHTLFAPTDDAFAAVAPDTLRSAVEGEGEATRFFHQHILAPVLSSTELRNEVRTSDGFISVLAGTGYLKLYIHSGHLNVAPCALDGDACRPPAGVVEAAVIEADIEAAGGVIHVIDGVLIPPSG